jgi:Rad3-related DNA helicase
VRFTGAVPLPVSFIGILPEPSALGLPSRFESWRPGQEDAALRAVESTKRFVVLALPTGSGKSLAYLAAAQLSGERTAFLTSTRGLQNQLEKDFGDSGLLDIRGQNNYPCLYKANGRTITMHDVQTDFADEIKCDEGPCHGGVRCELKESGCVYFDRVKLARQVTLVSTNYSYWMHQMENGGGLGPFSMLVLDEAHDALDQLSNYLAVELFPSDLDLVGEDSFPEHQEFAPWKVCSKVWLDRARSQREYLEAAVKGGLADGDSRQAVRQVKHLKKLERKLAQLSSAQGDWVFQVTRRGPSGSLVARFDPVWPADYAERRLFCGIKRVVLTSATIRPKTLELLGIPADLVDFQEYPSSFPPNRRPVYFVPSVRMDKRATPGHLRAWISKIDAIIRPRLQGKGIIHAVSYQRAQWIARNSEFAEHMLVHTRESSQDTIAKFKAMQPPAILVSPSVGTGYDFADDFARWQLIVKTPFPDTRDLVTKARTKRDRDFPMYSAMQELVQTAGRIVRSESDWGETIIVDDNFGDWFWPKFRKFAPKWFADAVQMCRVIPKPLCG